MKIRGQSSEAWRVRFRQGTCPVHGRGLNETDEPNVERCLKDDCEFSAKLWPGKDKYHSRLGWVAGPDKIKAALVASSDIRADSDEPGYEARMVRTSWPMGESEE